MKNHIAAFGLDCLVCHDGVDVYGKFDHSKVNFLISGKHANTECKGCHTGARKPTDLQYAPRDCFACHGKDDPHQGQLGQDCVSCHTPEDWKNVTFDHSQSSFSLFAKHITVECSACHTNALFRNTHTNCYVCYAKDDKHAGQFGTDCSACHTPAGWDQATFDHSKASFQLMGKHVGIDSTACHVGGKFKDTPTDCYSCHAGNDKHGGAYGTDCALCHDPKGWTPPHFDHSSFPLTGAHIRVACDSCHPGSRFKGMLKVCSGCHNDPAYHAGLFGTVCDQCHTTTAWQPAHFNQSHAFPINHGGNNTCYTCHPASLSRYTCYTCHNQNEIRAKHLEEGIRNFQNCVGCHPGGQTEGASAAVDQWYASLFDWLTLLWGSGW